MNDDSLVMSIPEFARAMGISRGLAYDLARRDALPLPVIKLGRRIVLSRKVVVALILSEKEIVQEDSYADQ